MKTYIGDSIYAEIDDSGDDDFCTLVLTTENGYPDDPRNRIVLDMPTLDALLTFVRSHTFQKRD